MTIRSNSLEELTDDQLQCHLHGRHSLGYPDIFLVPYRNGQAWRLIYECKACGVMRVDTCQPETFELWNREYDYSRASGYKLSIAATTQDFRGEVIRRRRLKKVEVSA